MIPIYKPYMPDNLMSELNNILYSGQLSYGKYGKQFESSLKEYIGCEYILTISSYNIAMQVVLSTLGLQFGDEVISSPVSCLASNQPFATKGLKVIWADINPYTGTLCPNDVEAKITTNTKAIFHNHFCGYVGDIDAINAIGEKYSIPIIDDGIEAFGSEFKGNKLGNVGTDMTVFSFQTVRLPNTIDGGAIVFKTEALFEKAKIIRDYGIDRTMFRDEMNEINANYDIKFEGYGALMSEVNSLIGLRQIGSLNNLLIKQRINSTLWDNVIYELKGIKKLSITESTSPNFWVYGLISYNKIETIKKFRKQGFYATSVHINNNIYSIFNNKGKLKGVSEFINYFVALPCGWWVENEQIKL
ncbi:DegT/DnrJ/EryC1/StrS family aminotransferase [Flavobacterium sp.]|uniref:DegT/DnrJ/EryC1/StrS family aminotransferase n=1 Tax=Flavobacterium sp. TaxID=239 RepID=UPI004047321B